MCGIAGIFHNDAARRIDPATLRRMTRVLRHRGPDGEGYYIKDNVGLGHRRLAIIDLTSGMQPMYSADRSIVLVFNGEIYNYVELRTELKTLGHHFMTQSDTEVIIAAYRQWGFDCQHRFNGMWALALWDERQNLLFISRDRIGEKPVHYSFREGTFVFGSEIKSVLAYNSDYKPATELLQIYLSLGYIPAPHTFYNGISRLLPGHYLIVRDGQVHDYTYWDLPPVTECDMRSDAKRLYEEFEYLFLDAVKLRMRSDVPFGAFLSGGLDSASVVAAMSIHSSSPVETFTIGFGERGFDERKLARDAARHFQTNHHERVAVPDMFDRSLERVLLHFDEPFGDASAMPVGLVSQIAREQVSMVLTGDGGDEVLSGYTNYVTEKLTSSYRRIPDALQIAIRASAMMVTGAARGRLRYRLNSAERFLRLAGASYNHRAVEKMSWLGSNVIAELVHADDQQVQMEDYFESAMAKCPFADGFYRQMYFNLKVSLPEDMLAKVDRMSMAYSLEARVPFLDHRLVELTYQIHKKVKLPGLERKNLLRRTIGRHLPPSLLQAPKCSFMVPLREWFKQDDFNERLQSLKESDFGLNNALIGKIIEANREGHNDYGDFIWRLFVLKHWIETPTRSLQTISVAN